MNIHRCNIKCYNFRDLKIFFKINKNILINKLTIIAHIFIKIYLT
jgi:hypothetical protein